MSHDADSNTAKPGREASARRTPFGLQLRSTMLVLCLTLTVVAVVGVLMADLAGQLLSRQKQEQAQQLAALLAEASAEPMARGDVTRLGELARSSCTGSAILFVAFNRPDGTVLVGVTAHGDDVVADGSPGQRPQADAPLGNPVFVAAHAGTEAHLEITYPINHPGGQAAGEPGLLGYVHVGLSVQRTVAELASALDFFSGTGLAFLVVLVPLVYLVVRTIVVPLNELCRTVRRVATGDLSARSSVRRSDEIGVLAESFNAMADEIERSHRQIVSLNTELDRRVQKRTEQLRELAAREPLTGLYNRRHFNEVLQRRFSEAVRYESDLSCLMIDLDDFKEVNDRHGHQVGDEVLMLVATIISSQLRAADLGARFGGDEFIVLLPQTSAGRAEVLATRVAEKFALDLTEQLPHVQVSMSIGISSVAEAAPRDADDLVRAADRAMYDAKDRGKGRIVLAGAAA